MPTENEKTIAVYMASIMVTQALQWCEFLAAIGKKGLKHTAKLRFTNGIIGLKNLDRFIEECWRGDAALSESHYEESAKLSDLIEGFIMADEETREQVLKILGK